MSFWHTLVDLLLPRHCAVCDEELCASEHIMCNVCLSRAEYVRWDNIEDNPILRRLWSYHDVEAAGSLFYYNSSSDFHNLFILLKYRHRPRIGLYLAQSAFSLWYSRGLALGASHIIPVPLSLSRQWKRGYNQSEWIARGISRVTGIPVCTSVLKRVRNNPTQTHRTASQRMENTQGLFAVRSKCPDLNDKIVLLVDDIFTTGATICDCIRALREVYPAVRIHIFTLGWAGND